jgi:sugar lactone lactonase YvrE
MNSKILLFLLLCMAATTARPASFYSQRLEDSKAVYVTPSAHGDDTEALQQAINQVQATTGQGIVMLAPGRYQLTNTLYIWPGIRLIGYGAERPAIVLPASTPGFADDRQEKFLLFFAGSRPREAESDPGSIPDATPGTFYSALANVDVEIGGGNGGAVAARARYAQHCFLAHMEMRLGSALAGIHEGGNVIEDVHFIGGTHAIWTSKPSPGWQFTVVDSSFEGQRGAAILEHEAGLTLIRPHFRHVPAAVEIEPDWADELWVQDARLEDISGPAFTYGLEQSARTEINLSGLTCRNVPVFAALRESGKRFAAPAEMYHVKTFFHGLNYAGLGAVPEIKTLFDAVKLEAMPAAAVSDLAVLPPAESWVNVRDLGARGDARTDDTEVLQRAINEHHALYLPEGCYVVQDTLKLKADTVLIGLHPGATQIILPDGTPAYQGIGAPKALIETPQGGSNILIGIGLYTGGNNRRAVAALWRAGTHSMMNDVRFLGGHGTPLPDGTRQNPYNNNHTGDPDPARRWDSQYPSLWVTDGGGGTFLDLWTPSTFAQAGMVVSDTETPGRAYQISSEHHVRHEIQVRHTAHWAFYALQTEEERGEGGFALPIEIDSSHDITVANFHSYRVISSYQPYPWAVKISNSHDIHFRNFHCDSNSKASFDDAVFDQTSGVEVRQHEFAGLDISGQPARLPGAKSSPVVAPGARVEKLAGGFFNISGGAAGPGGDFYFVDAHWQRIYRWQADARQLSTVCDAPLDPVNLAVDASTNLVVISYSGTGSVFALTPGGVLPLKPSAVTSRTGKPWYLPTSDWHLNQESLSHPAAHFVSPDNTVVVPAGQDFLEGATSWGVKSSPPIRSFGLGRATPGQPFYVTDESALRTWAADVQADGSLGHFRLFAEEGGESVTADARGNVYIAAGQIYVYDPAGKMIDTIEIPERPVQLVFGGADRRTLFIAARASLYAVTMRNAGW